MASLQLEDLHCILAQDPTGHDEVLLEVACDGGSWQYAFSGRMGEGEHRNLRTDRGFPFTDLALIRLSEYDFVGTFGRGPKILGHVEITHPLPDHTPCVADLPPGPVGAVGAGSFAYRLQYDVHSEPREAAPRFQIDLVSLRCDDAQGAYDRVYLYVNERAVLGPVEMRTRQEIDLGIRVHFRQTATIRLSEVHNQGWNSQFTVHPGAPDFPISGEPTPHRFSVDRGITGDARYTLTYRLWILTRAPAPPPG